MPVLPDVPTTEPKVEGQPELKKQKLNDATND